MSAMKLITENVLATAMVLAIIAECVAIAIIYRVYLRTKKPAREMTTEQFSRHMGMNPERRKS
jgi:hypothetical protein